MPMTMIRRDDDDDYVCHRLPASVVMVYNVARTQTHILFVVCRHMTSASNGLVLLLVPINTT